jgi:TRAP transporter 4TM/12TM fusion protein
MTEKKDISKMIIRIVVVAMFAYHFWAALTGMPEPLIVRPIHVAFVLFLSFIKFRASSKIKTKTTPWYDWALAILGVVCSLYILFDYERIVWRMPFFDPVEPMDYICGIITILLVLEATRRSIGQALSIVVIVIIFYTFTSNYFPGVLNAPALGIETFIDHIFLGSNGLFGSLTSLSLAEIFMFIMFGAFLQVTGGEALFSDVAVAATKNSIGGPAKACIIGSALFGCISGSGTANVFATGTITIPLMKKAGYKPHFAAAVEAVSSSLGQLIPPVMGSAAFVIAEFSQRPYREVALAAIVPSLLYIYAIYLAVHFEARKLNIGKYSAEDRNVSVRTALFNYGHLLLSVVVLLSLLIMRKTAYFSATMATVTVITVSWLRAVTRIGPKKFLAAIEAGIGRLISIAATLIAAGIAVAALQTSGTIYKITALMMQLAQGQMFLAVILVALITILLGMPLPPVATFLVASVFGAQALMEFGVEPFVTYMFIFMYGITAMITPPEASASLAAATIAETSFVKTGWHAVLLGLPAYIIPIFVVYNPTLLNLFHRGIAYGIMSFILAVLGITCLVSGVFGMLLKKDNIVQRIILIPASFALLWPSTFIQIIGLGSFLVVLAWQFISLRIGTKMNPAS